MLDAFDPNTWAEQEYRIYASNADDFYVNVDQADYSFLAQNRWSVHTYTNGHQPRKKLYLRRSVSDFLGPDGSPYLSQFTGRMERNRQRVQRNLFLHFVVMLRKMHDEQCYPPDKYHHIVDHEDRDTSNCRRKNLRWMTPSGNTLNVEPNRYDKVHE
jgi:hypothetical protein